MAKEAKQETPPDAVLAVAVRKRAGEYDVEIVRRKAGQQVVELVKRTSDKRIAADKLQDALFRSGL